MADRNLRLQVILEGLDKLTTPLKSITGASSAARRDLAKTAEQLKDLNKVQSQLGEFRQLKTGLRDSERAMREAQDRATQLGRAMAQAENPTKRMRAEFDRARRTAETLGAQHQQQQSRLQALRSSLAAAGVSTKDMASAERKLRADIERTNATLRAQTAHLDKAGQAKQNSDKLNDVSSKATGIGLGMVTAGVAMGAPVVAAVKQASTLESAMADVGKVTNMTRPQLERMSNDFLDMSEKIPMAAHELAAIAASAGAAGVGMDKFGKPMANQRQQLLEFTNDAAEMGVAFDMTADQAGETMAKWRTAFELPQSGVRALGDSVNALTNRFGGKAANVTDIVTRIGPLGKVAGLAAPEIAALGSTLDSIGIPSEVAATGIKNTMLALTKGEAATKSQREAFAELGLTATDVGKRMQTDASGAILDVMQRIQGLSPDKQAGILTQLFGSESVSAIAPLLTNLDGLKQRLDLVGNASTTAGSMHGEFLNRIATTEGATGLAGNALTGLNITLGKALLPTVVAVAGMVKSAASAFRGWAQENPTLAKGLMIFLGVGAALVVVVGGMALAFGALTAAAAPLGIALGPLLLIVAAIAAVAAAAYFIYANWGSIAGWFAALWAGIKNLFSAALNFIISALFNFSPMGLLMRAFMPAIAYLRTLNFTEIGRNLVQGLINGIVSMLGALRSTVLGAASAVANTFKAKLGIHSPSRVFAGLGGFVMAGLDQGLAANASAPISRITDLSGQMTQALSVGAQPGRVVAPAATGASATNPAAPGASGGNGATYNITINAGPGTAAADIAEEVRKAIEALERDRKGREFGDD